MLFKRDVRLLFAFLPLHSNRHCPFNTLKPDTSSPQRMTAVEITLTQKTRIPTRSSGIPSHTNARCCLSETGQPRLSVPSQFQIFASLIKEKHENGVKRLRQDFQKCSGWIQKYQHQTCKQVRFDYLWVSSFSIHFSLWFFFFKSLIN